MTPPLPLFAGYRADAPVLFGSAGIVTQGQFVARAQALALKLPSAAFAINLCADRARFMLGFAAAALRGQTTLLPSSPSDAAVADIRARYPDCHVLGDAVPDVGDTGFADHCPLLPADLQAAVLFTSGSTGTPQAHAKLWRTMRVIGEHLSQRLLDERPANIVATVPSQHMYGLETTALMAFGAGCAVHVGRPFFPGDVARALVAAPAPRVLVTTPVHLRALLDADVALPPLQFVLSATAPLSMALAAACEARWGAPVFEIYGCTEAGSTATRRTVDGPRWRLLPDTRLDEHGGVFSVIADHLPEPVPLQDVLEIDDAAHFRLLGRDSDLLKVAGKRASLADLTARLQALPGVVDAVIFSTGDGESARPAALVVAPPSLRDADILAALARQVDPVFLPRPLRRVERLPRNELGKLPRQRLLELLERGDG